MMLDVEVNVDEAGGEVPVGAEWLLERAVRAAAAAEGIDAGEVSVTLLDDAGITDLNQRFRGHDWPTDVLSFPLFDEGEPPVGDVYIGFLQAERQAAENGVSLEEELARLAVHGTLHVLGEEHPEGEERTQSGMWRLQEQIVASLFETE
jgi:probable rRNA maturation factor